MKTFNIDVDLGNLVAKKYHGQIPTENDFDVLLDSDEIGEDFIVYGPKNVIGKRPVLAGIKKGALPKETYKDAVDVMLGINTTSDLRTAQAGPWDPEELYKERGWVEGVDYKFKGNQNTIIVKKKNGEWDTVPRGKHIHSVLVGYKRNRFSGEVTLDAWSKKNLDKLQILENLLPYANQAYIEIAPKEFLKQTEFAEANIPKERRLGDSSYTTFSINRYFEGQTKAMGYHIDAGDLNSSLTCISVFRIGDYSGAYFVLPQHRIAVSVGDGDIFVGDSRKYHGVTQIVGEGTRLSCVQYCDTRLSTVKSTRRT